MLKNKAEQGFLNSNCTGAFSLYTARDAALHSGPQEPWLLQSKCSTRASPQCQPEDTQHREATEARPALDSREGPAGDMACTTRPRAGHCGAPGTERQVYTR